MLLVIAKTPEICHKYCKYAIFRDNFIFVNNVKRHICDVKHSPLGYDLPISVNILMISPILEGLIFMKLRTNKTLAKISEFTVSQFVRGISVLFRYLSSDRSDETAQYRLSLRCSYTQGMNTDQGSGLVFHIMSACTWRLSTSSREWIILHTRGGVNM